MIEIDENKKQVKNFAVFKFFNNFQKSIKVENLDLPSGIDHIEHIKKPELSHLM